MADVVYCELVIKELINSRERIKADYTQKLESIVRANEDAIALMSSLKADEDKNDYFKASLIKKNTEAEMNLYNKKIDRLNTEIQNNRKELLLNAIRKNNS